MDGRNDDTIGLNEPRVALPPHNAEVEAALLGAILTNNRAYERIADLIGPDHFHAPVHGLIYMAIADAIDAGRKASPLALRHIFEGNEMLEDAGGSKYLYDLASAVPDVHGAREYAEIIVGLWRDRRVTEISAAADADARQPAIGETSAGRIEAIIDKLSALIETDAGQTGPRPFEEIAEDTLAEIDRDRAGHELVGVATGFIDLDSKLIPLMPGDLTILGGRPGMGKSAFALNIALNAARAGTPVLFFSLEMGLTQLGRRALGRDSGIATQDLTGRRARDLSSDAFEALTRAVRNAKGLNLWIDETPGLSVPAIAARANLMRRRVGLGLIVVDYLQLMRAGAEARRQNSRVAEITDLSGALKGLAKTLKVPVLALSQLSRALELRNDKRPMLSDLRDSGSLEQDADNVLFVHREEVYLERIKDDDETGAKFNAISEKLANSRHKAEIIIAKQRQGPTGTAVLHWDGAHQAFSDFSNQSDMYDEEILS